MVYKQNIGIWCNGNTADSGPAFPGSNPGIPTQEKQSTFSILLLLCYMPYKENEDGENLV